MLHTFNTRAKTFLDRCLSLLCQTLELNVMKICTLGAVQPNFVLFDKKEEIEDTTILLELYI